MSFSSSNDPQRNLSLNTNSTAIPASCPPQVLVRLSTAKTTPVYESYWRFAAERQAIFFRRLEGRTGPWTEDPILRNHIFTNAYRASDRVSQYLIREVIYRGDPSVTEVCFRTLLFKFFNRIATWELLVHELGDISWTNYRLHHALRRASSCCALRQTKTPHASALARDHDARRASGTFGGMRQYGRSV